MILLAIGPSPGALRAPDIIRELATAGHRVEVVLQPNTEYFVGPAAFMALAPVVEEPTELPEAVIFAPAGAGELARLARGLDDGVAKHSYCSSDRPVVVAPELDEATREHPAVRENVRLLREDGRRVLEGSGDGMVSPLAVANEALNALGGPMSGLRVLVTAGGTREPIDKVRFVGNRSSGKMGRAVAREALRRGAEVTVVAASVEEKEPGTRWVDVESYAELEEATVRFVGEVDALVMAAAVSDFTPAEIVEGKIRRGGSKELELKLVATGDILKAVRESNPGLFMVGFAATHGDPVADAREKLESKNVDLVVGNDVSLSGSGFSSDENEVHIVGRAGEQFVSRAPKTEVARAILDALTREIGEKEVRKD
ncbi:MAG: bifunctional phosphopantothenoylcysteine decarboxylase/phosphopantothenate--cysteine ligase CoaBC [Actinomycetota bacterium]|nr:bifunctional phosphopantothenoylcysteine decarboxylase/phosphopantothenate--cysteine ligase CoaBC [Actinomycetota bacterium]